MINEALTRQVATLSRLDLTDAEVKTFTSQLIEITKYIDQLQTIDVNNVEPLFHPLGSTPALREDVAIPFETNSEGKSKMLDAAPEVTDGGFRVPPII